MTAAIRAQFDRCLPWISDAIARGQDTTAEEVLAELLAGRAQLWAGEEACIVTQCVQSERGPAVHAWLGGGALEGVNALRPGIEGWGRVMGCRWATINGRRGWGRLYRRFGYELDDLGMLRKAL